MKKLFLCAVALMIASVGFAQVTDWTGDTSPTPKVIAPLPGAAVDANTGLSIQNGDDNKVRVRQAGTLQSVRTFQDNGSGLGGNLARVMQTGSVSAASGVANVAEVIQSGTENQSTTDQRGDYNEAITRQGQINTASSGNKALIYQSFFGRAEDNYAAIDQDGHDNQAKTIQYNDDHDAWTQQNGDDNKSNILQYGTRVGHYAMNEQLGNRNESFIDQSGFKGRNTANMNQFGDDNEGQQHQVSTVFFGGNLGNRASLTQGVPGNYDLLPLLLPTFVAVNVLDTENVPVWGQTAESYGAVAYQIQVGYENAADMLQFGGVVGESNYGEQKQIGFRTNHNEAAMIQGHIGNGGDNYAKQLQIGKRNFAGIVQSGSGLKSLQTQFGDDNYVMSSQRGEGHLLNVHQRGDKNVATTAQAGLGNRALVVQRDGQSYAVQQNLNLGRFDLSAGNNQADILQLGPNGNFNTDGIPCYFENPLDIYVNYNVPSFSIDDICMGCN